MAFWFSLMLGVGVVAWVYSKIMHRSNSTQSSIIAAGVVGIIAFIVFFIILKISFHM